MLTNGPIEFDGPKEGSGPYYQQLERMKFPVEHPQKLGQQFTNFQILLLPKRQQCLVERLTSRQRFSPIENVL